MANSVSAPTTAAEPPTHGVLAAAASYFGAVFALGFGLGVLRTLVLLPLDGPLAFALFPWWRARAAGPQRHG